MKKRIIIIFSVIIFIWLICIIKCEINTWLYGDEFKDGYKQTNMIGGNPKPKVLSYSEEKSKVYYVDEFGGDILLFEKINGEWILEEWIRTVWAKGGSADGFMWPYGR